MAALRDFAGGVLKVRKADNIAETTRPIPNHSNKHFHLRHTPP
ncbi:hypothetical protein [Streptomyces parvulus]|nr:hypothetical protein [Streptomyces parvulus]